MNVTEQIYNNIKEIDNLHEKTVEFDSIYKNILEKRRKKILNIFKKLTKSEIFTQIDYFYNKNQLTFTNSTTSEHICSFSFIGASKPIDWSVDNSSREWFLDLKLDLGKLSNTKLQNLNNIVLIGKISEVISKNKKNILNDLNKYYNTFFKKIFTKIRPFRQKYLEEHSELWHKSKKILCDQMLNVAILKGLNSQKLIPYVLDGKNETLIEYNNLNVIKNSKDNYTIELINLNNYKNIKLESINYENVLGFVFEFFTKGNDIYMFKNIIDYLNKQNGEIL